MKFAQSLGLAGGGKQLGLNSYRQQVRFHWARELVRLGLVFPAFFPLIALGQIESVTRLTARPCQYERLDFVIMLTARWETSPYCAEEVRLDLKLAAPSGISVVAPAFFEHGQSGHPSVWRARFTPVEPGDYTGAFVLTHAGKTDLSAQISFAVAASGRRGFLHAANDWTLRFDNGESFRGVGENIAWEARNRDDSRFFRDLQENPRYNYEYMLGTLAANGGNFFRTWMCPWNLPLEWKTVANTNRYARDDGHFNASACERLDELVDLAGSLDLYLMLTLDNSGDFQGWGWRQNSYNAAQGGPAATPQDFFTDPGARAQYKDRLRYLVARWGYSPNLGAWEFFNEIDNLMHGLPQQIPDDVVTAWHAEMSAYLKSIDPYHHLVTTSISHRTVAGLNEIPSLDFNQRHIYGHDGRGQTATFPDVLRRSSRDEAKPLVIGEYGFEWDWNRNFDELAAGMDGDFKRGLWLGLFSPTPILPMSWWWEYFDHRGVTPYISRVRSMLDRMLAAGNGSFAEATAQWHGPRADVLAVRCGETIFVLIGNEGTNAITGELSVLLAPAQEYCISAFDPERNVTCPLPSLSSGDQPITGIAVSPANSIIVIASPKAPARGGKNADR
ncbi:MAG: cellulase family glycosylhydrolase [Verrucomicrobiota bacterium]|jgi:hypothetical protein